MGVVSYTSLGETVLVPLSSSCGLPSSTGWTSSLGTFQRKQKNKDQNDRKRKSSKENREWKLKVEGLVVTYSHCTSDLKADVFLNKKLSIILHV